MSLLDYDGLNYHTGKFKTWVKKLLESKSNTGHKHTKSDITDFPKLGTASSKDIASNGNASTTQVVMGNDTRLTDARKASDVSAWAKASTKPSYTKSEVGLGNVDNTSDTSKPVSTAQQTAIDTAYANSNKYTDKKVADLIGSAPETMDTLEEVAAAIQKNKDVETALNAAIGTKASQAELDTHTSNSTIHITASERTNWNIAKTHADSAHARTDATKVEKSSTNGNIKINGTETNVYTHPSGTNPHGTTKSDIGLGNVDNTADSAKSVKYATSAGSASSSSKATGVVDYGATNQTIQIGYGGKGISGDDIKHIAGYTSGNDSGVSAKIKDISKDALKSWLGLDSLYASVSHNHDDKYLCKSSDATQIITSSAVGNGNILKLISSNTVEASIVYTSKEGDTSHSWVSGIGVGGDGNFGWWDGKSGSTRMYLTRNGDLCLNNGSLKRNGNAVVNTGTDGSTNFSGGTNLSNGAVLILRGKDQKGIEGMFQLAAKNSSGEVWLNGYPNGALTWGNTNILTSDNYSLYALPKSGGSMKGSISMDANTGISFNHSQGGYATMLRYNTSSEIMFKSADATRLDTSGFNVGNSSYNTKVSGYRLYFYGTQSISADSTIHTGSDEKVKTFTNDIQEDEDKLIKLFDIVTPRSYNYKYTINNKLDIGFSAQEVEKIFNELDIDPEKYSILDIQYNYMLPRGGEAEEDYKYYTKFMSISYSNLYTLAMLKIRRMEEDHTTKLKELEYRLVKLEGGSN